MRHYCQVSRRPRLTKADEASVGIRLWPRPPPPKAAPLSRDADYRPPTVGGFCFTYPSPYVLGTGSRKMGGVFYIARRENSVLAFCVAFE